MKIIEIDIDSIQQPNNLAIEFEQNNLEKGDKILFKSTGIQEKTFIIMAVLVVVVAALGVYFFKKQEKIKLAEKLINDAFENGSIDEIEIEIESKFGVSVSVEDKEDEMWNKYSIQQLAKAYSDTEPDYTNIPSVTVNPFLNAN
jgi:hypothetical protein